MRSFLESSQRITELEDENRSQKEIVDKFQGRMSEMKEDHQKEVNKLQESVHQKDRKCLQLREEVRDYQMNKKELGIINQHSLLEATK